MAFSNPNPAANLPATAWDPWVLKDDDQYRLFYLSGQPDQEPWWKSSSIYGAVSSDLMHWQHQGPVLEPLADQGWESGRIFAGNCYKEQGRYYLFYSAASAQDFDQETIGLATSTDGVTWQRQPEPLLKLPGKELIYGRCDRTNHLHWRDPAIYKDPASGKYYLYFCAFLTGMGSGTAHYLGGVGLAVADQIAGPYQLLPPPAGPTAETAATWPFYHLERPQILYLEGQFHLFFSCFKEFVNPQWLATSERNAITDSTLYWYIADSITGPFRPIAPVPVVAGSHSTGLYGTQFFLLNSTEERSEMVVLGWFHQTYKLAVCQEFKGLYQAHQFSETLRIVSTLSA